MHTDNKDKLRLQYQPDFPLTKYNGLSRVLSGVFRVSKNANY